MTIQFLADTTGERVISYPDGSGTLGFERYRGSDYTTVVSPVVADYTLEADKLWFFNGTVWGQTPYMLGSEVVINANPTLVGINSVSIGINSNAPGLYATALGDSANAAGDNSVAIGDQSYAGSLNGVAIGESARAELGANTVAIGFGANAIGVGSVAIGQGVTVSGAGSVGIGTNSLYSLTVAGGENFAFGYALNIPVGAEANAIFGDGSTLSAGSSYNAIFGSSHTLSGSNSRGSLVVGEYNKVSAPHCIATGFASDAHIPGAIAHSTSTATGNPNTDMQSLQVHLKGFTIDANPVVLLAGESGVFPSSSNQLSPLPSGVITFQGIVEASRVLGTGQGATWAVSGRVHRLGSPTETGLSFVNITPLWNPSNLVLSITADDTHKCAKFTFSDPSAGGFKIIALLNCVEVLPNAS